MIRARFLKKALTDGSQNIDDSYWEVSNDIGEKVFVISVNEITLVLNLSYDEIATKKFGIELIKRVRAIIDREKQEDVTNHSA